MYIKRLMREEILKVQRKHMWKKLFSKKYIFLREKNTHTLFDNVYFTHEFTIYQIEASVQLSVYKVSEYDTRSGVCN